jgi:hypothetical protein
MTLKVFKGQRFVYCDVHVCYGTVVEHRSMRIRNYLLYYFFVHTAVLSCQNTLIIPYHAIDSVKCNYFYFFVGHVVIIFRDSQTCRSDGQIW